MNICLFSHSFLPRIGEKVIDFSSDTYSGISVYR